MTEQHVVALMLACSLTEVLLQITGVVIHHQSCVGPLQVLRQRGLTQEAAYGDHSVTSCSFLNLQLFLDMLKRQTLGQVVLECWEVDAIVVFLVVLVSGLKRVPKEVGERTVGLGLISHFNDYNKIRQYYCSIYYHYHYISLIGMFVVNFKRVLMLIF